VIRILLVFAAVLVKAAGAQGTGAATGGERAVSRDCRTDTLNAAFPKNWIGTRVGQITIDSRNVEAPTPFLSSAMQFLHHPTRLSVAENELSFGAGDHVDSLLVLESVRRLRRTQLFSEIIVSGVQCSDGVTDFRIASRDAWSVRADARYGRLSSRVSLAEINLLGTGRSVTATAEQVDGRNAVSFGIIDPHLFHTRLRGSVLLRNYEDGRAWQWSLRTREFTPRDVWRFAITSYQVRRLGTDPTTATTDSIDRRASSVTASWRFRYDGEAAYALVFGAEYERANLSVFRTGVTLGRSTVRRQFAAPLIGISRRSLRYGAIDWLVPGQPPAELPLGLEGEVVIAAGHDQATNAAILHTDGWAGGTAMLSSGTILTGDVWTSGYFNQDSVSNGTLRFATALYQRAARGMWILRVASERVYNPDPDVFALSTLDPMLRSLTPNARLAESALTVTAERTLHLYSTEGRWAVDGSLFTTYTERHRSVDLVSDVATNPEALIVGIGFRRVRNQPTQSPLTLNIGRSVWRNADLPNRWIISLSTVPWLNAGRFRDGLREAAR
jgi:hypothetical protein